LYFNGTQLELTSGIDKEALLCISRDIRGVFILTRYIPSKY